MGACLATACCTPCVAGDQSKTKYVGMKKNRSCTDVICCLVYFISVVGFFGLALLSYLYGEFFDKFFRIQTYHRLGLSKQHDLVS